MIGSWEVSYKLSPNAWMSSKEVLVRGEPLVRLHRRWIFHHHLPRCVSTNRSFFRSITWARRCSRFFRMRWICVPPKGQGDVRRALWSVRSIPWWWAWNLTCDVSLIIRRYNLCPDPYHRWMIDGGYCIAILQSNPRLKDRGFWGHELILLTVVSGTVSTHMHKFQYQGGQKDVYQLRIMSIF